MLGLLLVAPQLAEAANDKPIKLSEVSTLIDAGVEPAAVLKVMAKRGVGFRISSSASRRLKEWGFTDEHLDLIERMSKGEKVDLDAKPEPAGGDDAKDEGGAEAAGDFPVGYPHPQGWHAAEKNRIERAMQAAGLGYKRIEFGRVSLYCNARRAGQLTPMLKNLEKQLTATFPASISNACAPQSAHIILVDGDSEWNNWVDAFFDSYEKDGIRFSFGPEVDARTQIKNGGGSYMPTVAMTNAGKMKNDEAVGRFAAYATGHLMMQMAAGMKQPHGLRTGFANYAEAVAYKTPSVLVYSYEKRDLGQGNAWKNSVLQRFNNKEITKISKPWNYSTSDMKFEHYAECWSYVSTLAAAPDKFAKAVGIVREGKSGMFDAVNETYGMKEIDMLKTWYKFVSK